MNVINTLITKTLPYVPKSIVGRVSQRYIAGIELEDAVRVVKEVNQKKMMVTLDILGEDILEREPATQMVREWKEVVDAIQKYHLDSNISVKLSQLGLRIDNELCYSNVRAVVEYARMAGNFVRIDMEDSSVTDATIEIFTRLRNESFENVGIVIQAYLHRSEEDVRKLLKLKSNFRLCKGIYIEPTEIAFKERDEIRDNFVKLLQVMFDDGAYVGIATHDEYLVEESYKLIEERKLQPNQYEFQMLLGVRERLRDSIVRDGHRLRVYIPFGEQWYAYSVRRLKENPQIAGYVMRSMLGLEKFK